MVYPVGSVSVLTNLLQCLQRLLKDLPLLRFFSYLLAQMLNQDLLQQRNRIVTGLAKLIASNIDFLMFTFVHHIRQTAAMETVPACE
ncbi:hypothetical protein ACWJJH_03525 [Endozoicomonadaceae bacterium StTr2]